MPNEVLEGYTEEYFRRRGKGSSYTEDYWVGARGVLDWFTTRFRLIERDIASSKAILDVGCGLGHSSKVLREIGASASVVAIDVSVDAVRRAKDLYGDDPLLHFLIADAQALPIRREGVDLVVAVALYEHLECPVKFLREASRISRKCFIITDNARSIGAILKGNRWVGIRDRTHKSLTTPEQLKINLISVGFNRCKCFTHGFPIINTICKVFRRKIIRSPLGLGGEIICIAEKVG